ncbi:PerC family transcriptional regulator [Hafnia alvei]|uniref:PerC family transcriptional regulator n=2 Tax=Hafnia alvei TaxID=569 RepID=A0ABD7Q9K0_HAFAL|nr:PerC family transcriptional regulator [Hafnia alvei]
MTNKIAQRHNSVLRYIQQTPHVTARLLRIALPLHPKDIQQTLGLLSRREYVLRGAVRGHHSYTITTLGDAWLHENDRANLTPEHMQRLDKYRKQAERLEELGFWNRAARQWLHVLDLSPDDDARIAAVTHRERCIRMLSQ